MIRMLRLRESYKNVKKHLEASKCAHHIDYSIHASILSSDQVKDIAILRKEFGINSFKIYMNLGEDLNHIFVDQEPGTHRMKESEVNMTDELASSIIEEASMVHSPILIHAEDPTICSQHIHKARKEKKELGTNSTMLKIWSDCRPPSAEVYSISKGSRLRKKVWFKYIFCTYRFYSCNRCDFSRKRKG